MARPSKDQTEKKRFVIRLRMTEAEYRKLLKISEESKISLSHLLRDAAEGMKCIYITDEMVKEARELSRNVSLVGNLLRLHATLLETVSLNPSLAPSDQVEIVRIRELLALSAAEIKNTRQAVIGLRTELRKLTNGNL